MHGGEHPGVDLTAPGASGDTEFNVGYLTRVEGEGSLRLKVRAGEVTEARLSIFEAPRYFEKLVVGRTPDEVLDIIARICGICPIAYQMSAVHAFEDHFGIEVDPEVQQIRRLLYAGEWIQSHALHIYMLHAPDFLGFPSALAMAGTHRAAVERGLKLKKIGNRLIAAIGGRAIHPVSVRVGGFTRAPRKADIDKVRALVDEAIPLAQETVDMVASFTAPDFHREALMVSMKHETDYPYSQGRIVSNRGMDIALNEWDTCFAEQHVEGTNALHARTADGEVYLLGPSSRVTLAADQLHPLAKEALDRTGLAEEIRTNIYWSIAARAVELLHAFAEARDILDAYKEPAQVLVPWQARAGRAAWATEAPRGMCWHRYEIDEAGRIAEAQIVPPTSQNQARIEEDLRVFAPTVLHLPKPEATHQIEQMIRSYDPCISCATHFLDLSIEEV